MVIPAGSTSVLVSVPVLGDNMVELDETLTGTISGPQVNSRSVTLGSPTTSAATIVNDDATVSIAAGSAGAEGSSNVTFTVSRNLVSTSPTTVKFTLSGTAIAGSDYDAIAYVSSNPNDPPGTYVVTIPANSHSATITLPVNDDQRIEGTESVVATVTAADNGGSIDPTPATENITDNDSATVTLSGTANVVEGGSPDSLTVTLHFNTTGMGTPSLDTDITNIQLAANPSYSSTPISFSATALDGPTQSLSVSGTADTVVTGSRTFTAALAAVPGSPLTMRR